MPKQPIHASVKKALGYDATITDKALLKDWNERLEIVCKPCWELKYCPYGPLVEEFPLLPVLRDEAVAHHDYLKECLQTGKLGGGGPLDERRKKWFEQSVAEFDPNDHPTIIPPVLTDAACRVFGHVCPVFSVAEPLTETKKRRSHSRYVPTEVMLKVVRRDGQICQICNKPVPDNDVEFDHVIPFARGGPTTVENLRLVHASCNNEKSDALDEILHPHPIEHLNEISQQRPARKRKKARDA